MLKALAGAEMRYQKRKSSLCISDDIIEAQKVLLRNFYNCPEGSTPEIGAQLVRPNGAFEEMSQ